MLKKKDEKIIKKYLNLVNKTFYIKNVFLFGSYAKKTNKKFSDIDLALVSPDFEDIPYDVSLRILFRLARFIDSSIEAIPLTENDILKPKAGTIAYEIVKNGIMLNQNYYLK